MSTELMTATNDSGTISMTGYHREKQRRYQITITGKGFDHAGYTTGTTRVVSVEVDAETIANMQRCVNHYETPEV
jgi:hypothetical protein